MTLTVEDRLLEAYRTIAEVHPDEDRRFEFCEEAVLLRLGFDQLSDADDQLRYASMTEARAERASAAGDPKEEQRLRRLAKDCRWLGVGAYIYRCGAGRGDPASTLPAGVTRARCDDVLTEERARLADNLAAAGEWGEALKHALAAIRWHRRVRPGQPWPREQTLRELLWHANGELRPDELVLEIEDMEVVATRVEEELEREEREAMWADLRDKILESRSEPSPP
jgi:hypothetical protein